MNSCALLAALVILCCAIHSVHSIKCYSCTTRFQKEECTTSKNGVLSTGFEYDCGTTLHNRCSLVIDKDGGVDRGCGNASPDIPDNGECKDQPGGGKKCLCTADLCNTAAGQYANMMGFFCQAMSALVIIKCLL